MILDLKTVKVLTLGKKWKATTCPIFLHTTTPAQMSYDMECCQGNFSAELSQ